MSLDYNLSAIKDHKTVCFKEGGEMIPETERLIFSTLGVGIPKITKANHETFLRRLHLWETVYAMPLTPPDVVKAHIGLTTNASPCNKGRFITRMKQAMYEKLPKKLREGL